MEKLRYKLGDPFVTLSVVTLPRTILLDGIIKEVFEFKLFVKYLQVEEIRIGRAYPYTDVGNYGPQEGSAITYILSNTKNPKGAIEGAFSPIEDEDFLVGHGKFCGIEQKAFPRMHHLFMQDAGENSSYVQQVTNQIYSTYGKDVHSVHFSGYTWNATRVKYHG